VMSEMRYLDRAFTGNQRASATGTDATTIQSTFDIIDVT